MIKGSISGRERCLRKRVNRVENFSLAERLKATEDLNLTIHLKVSYVSRKTTNC